MKAPSYTADHQVDLSRRATAGIVAALLAMSLVLLAVAPIFVADSYNWIEQTTSESAGQGVDNAWIARVGFVLMGLSVLLLARLAGRRWGLMGRIAHRGFGTAMIFTAVFASKPWENLSYVEFEDTLHSWASAAVGVSFIAGVLIVLLRRPISDRSVITFDWLALAVAVVVSVLVFAVDGVAGLVQRAMFLTAYIWYGLEAFRSARVEPHSSEAMAERMLPRRI